MLAEGEVAGAGVEDHIDALAAPAPPPGRVGDPGVLADLEADPHAAARRSSRSPIG